MQVTGQNVQQKNVQHPQYSTNSYAYVPNTIQSVQTQTTNIPAQTTVNQTPAVPHNNIPQVPPQYNPQYCAPQYAQYPQMQTPQPAQNYQVPASTSGVNIQIFNPSVSTPGAQAATYNVNAPCYPANYYTGHIGQNPNGTNGNNINNGTNNGTIGNNNNNTTNTTNNTTTSTTNEKKKTEKKKIVQLTDDYIRNLENYLNSQEKDVRLSAAKEVYARLEEDESRKDDKALTALINKMLQDPAQEIRILALTALEGRIVTGDDFTVGLLQRMQQSKDGYGQDAVDASRILLQMSGKQVEKEVPVKENSKTKTEKKETKESSKG